MIRRYLLHSKALIFSFVALACVSAFFSIAFAFVLSIILDTIVAGDLERLKQVAAYSILFSLAFATVDYVYSYMQLLILKKAMMQLKADLFAAIMKKTIIDFGEEASGAYINELTANCSLFEERYFKNLCGLPYLIVSFIAAAVATVTIHAYLLFFMVFMGICMMAITKAANKPLQISTAAYTKSTESYTITMKENLAAFSLIKTSNLVPFILNVHNDKNKVTEECKFDNKNKYLLYSDVSFFIGIFSTISIMLATGYLSILGVVTTGAVLAVGQLMGRIISPINSFAGLFVQIKSASVLSERFNKILTYEGFEGTGYDIEDITDSIVFKDVNFSYGPDAAILRNIEMEFEKGKKYAIVGSSGSGKTTLLKLLLGYFKKYSGEIFVNRINIKEINLNSLYDQFGIVSQDIFLFNDSLKNNITLFADYPAAELQEAIAAAGLTDFMQRQPQAENTLIGENGNALSGGERQRIAIARALLKKYKVLLLDEVTSNLDAQTAATIEQTFLSLKNITILMVTHRLNKNLLKQCDGIVALKNGAIVEKGTFDELIEQKNYFYSLFKINT